MPRILLRLILAAAVTLLAFPAKASMAVPEQQTQLFDIVRHGDIIGTHSLVFRHLPGRVEVTIDISVRVTVFTFTAYRFEQHGSEIWENGRFKSMTMNTDDNGDVFKVRTEATGGHLKTTVNGKTADYDPMPPATLWRPIPVQPTWVLDPTDGKPTKISVTDLGMETITVRGKPAQARRLRWDGDLKRNLWHDSTGMLVQVHVLGDDGSDIYYVLK